jgi:hypothetical protein
MHKKLIVLKVRKYRISYLHIHTFRVKWDVHLNDLRVRGRADDHNNAV